MKQASLALEAYFIFVLIVVSGVCELISVKYSFFKPIHSNTSAYEKACVFYFFATNMVSTPLLLCVEELNIIISLAVCSDGELFVFNMWYCNKKMFKFFLYHSFLCTFALLIRNTDIIIVKKDMEAKTYLKAFFKMKENITISVMRVATICALVISVILIPVGLYYWILGSWIEQPLGITLVTYGISGIITSFFVQGFVYIVKAAIFYLRQNGQVEELEDDDDFYSEE